MEDTASKLKHVESKLFGYRKEVKWLEERIAVFEKKASQLKEEIKSES